MSSPPTRLGEDHRLQENGAEEKAEAWLWWSSVPALEGERLGVIGHFFAETAAAAHTVLREAERCLRSHGCTLGVGPMDGNTWRRYRLVTQSDSEPPFFLEPTNPSTWPEWWRSAGYGALAEYYSTITDDLGKRDLRLESVAARMTAAGITIRPLNADAFEAELTRIYDVSAVSFQQNYLYTPLPEGAFLAQYRAMQDRVRPELILLAEQGSRPVGYVFAVPDFAQAQRGSPIDTLIVKTLAVLPGRAYAGLGAWLLGEVHAAGQRLGFTRAIHALMHETNQSRNLSAHYARTIRRYTLFSKRLVT
jgi:GNAT superfamily N-acetyltransferase